MDVAIVAHPVQVGEEPLRVKDQLCPLVPFAAPHAMLERDVVNEGVVGDLLDEAQEPEDRVPRVLNEESDLLQDKRLGNLRDGLVD